MGCAQRHAGRDGRLTIRVRLARADDLVVLPDIERSAAARFRNSSQAAIADDAVSPAAFHARFQADGLVWVAEADGRLIGFATCEAFADALHLWELAVARDQQGRGAGRALVAAVAEGARARALPAVTLTTFRDIGWNAPLYRRWGFQVLEESALTPRLREARALEAARGLDVDARCVMRLPVG